jgi:hypothetical protein
LSGAKVTDATIEIEVHLPRDVTLIDGKLMQHPESDFVGPELIQCAARAGRPNSYHRCKNELEYYGICNQNGYVKIGEHWVGVREAPRLTAQCLDRWRKQLCVCHYRMRDRFTYAVTPQWIPYDVAPVLEKISRIETLITELW